MDMHRQTSANVLSPDHPSNSEFPFQDIYSSVWKAAAAFFILGFIVLAVAIILAIVSFCVVILIPWAKTVMSVVRLGLGLRRSRSGAQSIS